jgi:SAM-dependent methyltransferase
MLTIVMAEPADVRDYYDRWTEKYVDDFGECIQAHRPASEQDLLDYLLTRSGIRDGQRVLDAGCGICGPARHFASRRRIEVEALTISPVQAEIARARNAAASLDDRIHVSVGDFHALSALYGREAFDVVYFLESLSHSAQPADALGAAYDVLKPGGVVYVKDYFIRRCEDADEQRRVLEVVARVDELFATRTAWVSDVRDALRQAGFFPRLVERPRFTVDNGPWQRFESRHQLDLFAGADSFDWSEWWELRYQKP